MNHIYRTETKDTSAASVKHQKHVGQWRGTKPLRGGSTESKTVITCNMLKKSDLHSHLLCSHLGEIVLLKLNHSLYL